MKSFLLIESWQLDPRHLPRIYDHHQHKMPWAADMMIVSTVGTGADEEPSHCDKICHFGHVLPLLLRRYGRQAAHLERAEERLLRQHDVGPAIFDIVDHDARVGLIYLRQTRAEHFRRGRWRDHLFRSLAQLLEDAVRLACPVAPRYVRLVHDRHPLTGDTGNGPRATFPARHCRGHTDVLGLVQGRIVVVLIAVIVVTVLVVFVSASVLLISRVVSSGLFIVVFVVVEHSAAGEATLEQIARLPLAGQDEV
uniref:Uncharacterized protein n=1 Tax=Anopheles atroparvus TaxID=41427 RepID=A0A182J0G6_ANOAO